MRGKIAPPAPALLACALMEDGERALFLMWKTFDGKEEIGLPCVFVMKGEDPASAIRAEFLRATGIDGMVGAPARSGRYNAGTKRRRAMIPAIAFSISAKSTRCTPSKEYAGVKWLDFEAASKMRISRKSQWLVFGRD